MGAVRFGNRKVTGILSELHEKALRKIQPGEQELVAADILSLDEEMKSFKLKHFTLELAEHLYSAIKTHVGNDSSTEQTLRGLAGKMTLDQAVQKISGAHLSDQTIKTCLEKTRLKETLD